MAKATTKTNGGKVLPFQQTGEFYYKRGLSMLDNNQLLNAMAYYRRALELEPDNEDVKLSIAEVLTEMNRFEDSNRVLFTLFANQKRKPSECYFGMGCNFVGMQEYEQARSSFEHYAKLDPEGEFIYDAYDMLDALDDTQSAQAEEADQRLQELTRQLMNPEDYKKTIATLEELVEEEPDFLPARNSLALAYYCEKDFDKATHQVREVLDRDPDNIQAHCNLAVFMRGAHDEEGIKAEGDFLASVVTEEPDELNRVAVTLMELGRFLEAYPFIKQLFHAAPYDTGVTHRLAICAYETGDYRRAVDCYDRLLKLNAQDSVARYYRGVCRAALAGAKPKVTFSFNYQVPLDEVLSRIHKLNEYLGKPQGELGELWKQGGELELLLRWGLDFPEPAIKRAMLALAASFRDAKAELILRDFLLQKDQPKEVKQDVFGLLKHIGAKEPYIAYLDAELVESRVSIIPMLEDVPKAYNEVLEILFSGMQEERDPAVLEAAGRIWKEYSQGLDGFPRLTAPQTYAMAAVLEYAACREREIGVTKTELCRKYGVTLVRFNNAMTKIMNRKRRKEP